MSEKDIHVYVIGMDGTEVYAAHSEEEMRDWFRRQVGEDAEDELEFFTELTKLDEEFEYSSDGETIMTTWRKLASEAAELPAQISTGYC